MDYNKSKICLLFCEDNEIIRTYRQERISWDFLKKAVKIKDIRTLDESNVNIIAEFVCDFFGNKFGRKKLMKHTDVEQLLAVAGHIINRVITMMQENGVTLPEAEAATEK